MATKKLSSAATVTTDQAAEKMAKNIANQTSADADSAGKDATNFPIIGIGASAGGLEAFEQFFSHVAENCGMAFVLVQHLDPNHNSMLGEILQRSTRLPICEAEDQMQVLPNNVYVIPPNRDMAIFNGKLQLNIPIEPRSQRLPIDTFMRSLADERGESAGRQDQPALLPPRRVVEDSRCRRGPARAGQVHHVQLSAAAAPDVHGVPQADRPGNGRAG